MTNNYDFRQYAFCLCCTQNSKDLSSKYTLLVNILEFNLVLWDQSLYSRIWTAIAVYWCGDCWGYSFCDSDATMPRGWKK